MSADRTVPAGPARHDVVVVGSANLDVVLQVDRLPRPGETVLALERTHHPGGKGLNQAVAASRAGARTAMVAALGQDPPGDLLVSTLREAAVDTTAVSRLEGGSGVATIVVQASGENTIVVDAGANARLTRLSAEGRDVVARSAVLVAQLEVPLSVVREAAALARSRGATVVLNAAPARPLDAALLDLVDVLVVNEHEALVLAGQTGVEGQRRRESEHVPGEAAVEGQDERVEPQSEHVEGQGEHASDALAAAQRLTGPARSVVVTLGARGAAHVSADGSIHRVPGLPAAAVDTTAAGDAFVGVLAAGLAAGQPLPAALPRAVAAGALAVETAGAVPSIPTCAAVDARLRSAGT